VSSRKGGATRHWRNQRLTSVALIPLSLWFLFALLQRPDLQHATVSAWLSQPSQALLAALFGGASVWHSMQGVEVVLEDYVRGRALEVSLWVARLVHVAAALALVFAVWTLALADR
jgi:succinate dehydrogenase / fumarate reductase, membrane anchor subunit